MYSKRIAAVSALSLLLTAGLTGADKPAAEVNKVELNGHTFTLPPGFEIELVAGPPLVNRPIVADFDEQGRLYVADSSGSNDKVTVQLEKKPHRILRLESTKGDGKFDKSTVFADQMMFPEGVMWHAGSLYVAAPPSIWKLTDTRGTGTADQRSEWFQGKTLTGCANDLHGPYLGPDGWIYWCKGAFAKQTYERPGKKPFETRASHIFRCRPDGTGLEPVMTGGMDNPVDVVFTPGGERIFTTTFFQYPAGGQRDGLIHAVYGGIYGKDHDVIYDPVHKWTSPELMPVLTHLGPAAPCGLTRYESKAFGPDYQDNLFACLFNMQKVTRHVLEPSGATFKTHDSDFVVSSNRDFHPTDVIEDADGSLLVIDTGGWYKLCCPTSQLHKPDVLGAIYRIRRKGAAKVEDPRGLKLDLAELPFENLIGLMADGRPAVRKRAVNFFAKHKRLSVGVMEAYISDSHESSVRSSPELGQNAVWALTRIDDPRARAMIRSFLTSSDASTRQAALHSISLWRDREALPKLRSLIESKSPHDQRAAAEALGRIGDKSAIPALLKAIAQTTDRFLEHSLIYALIEIADREGTALGLKSDNPRVRRAALIALDQMDEGKLSAATVAALLTSTEPSIKETASWIVGRHPEWGGDLAGFLRDRLNNKELTAAERDELTRHLARFAKSAAVQQLLAERVGDLSAPKETCRIALRAMAQAGLKEAPEAWVAGLTQRLTSKDAELLADAVATARSIAVPKPKAAALSAELLKIGAGDAAVNVRLAALAAVPGGLSDVPAPLFDFVRKHLDREQSVLTRTLAADVLSRSTLTSAQLITLTDALKSVGPMEVERLLDAYAKTTDEAVGLRLIAALNAPAVRSGLRADALKQRLAKYGSAVQKQAEELYSALNADAAKQKARLDELLTKLDGGDVRRGQAVFNGPKAACASCHAIGYLGGKVGPDLTRIGQIRNERDLLEAIVFPSASFVRGYEPVVVATKDGKVYNGLVRKDTPEEVQLVLNATQEVRIARDDIDDMQPSKVSVMPAGFDQQLTVGEIADLVAFLKACK
jgi:putative membrane-bound dehydrogenase-like protein